MIQESLPTQSEILHTNAGCVEEDLTKALMQTV